MKRTELRLPDDLYIKLLDAVVAKKKEGKNTSLNQEIVDRLNQSFKETSK